MIITNTFKKVEKTCYIYSSSPLNFAALEHIWIKNPSQTDSKNVFFPYISLFINRSIGYTVVIAAAHTTNTFRTSDIPISLSCTLYLELISNILARYLR